MHISLRNPWAKQAIKDKQVVVAIEQWHSRDDTLGHRKLAALLHMGKKPGAASHAQIRDRSSTQTEKICVSRQNEPGGAQPGLRARPAELDGGRFLRHFL